MVGVHERNISPQDHFQNTTLNDHYIYELVGFFSLDIHVLLD
jgi:hypothetical protein